MLRRMHFIDHDGYQNFQIFAPILSSLTLDNNKKGTVWISTGISPEKLNDSIVTKSNSANCRVILKFNNSILVQKNSSLLYSKFI